MTSSRATSIQMAGFVPAIPVCTLFGAVALGLTVNLMLLPSAWAQAESRAPRAAQLRGHLLLAEQNLKLASDQMDFSRAELVVRFLSVLGPTSDGGAEACNAALDGLHPVAGSILFRLHPVTEEISDRFSTVMRPTDSALEGWFAEGSSRYQAGMKSCEETIGVKQTSRILPNSLPSQKK